MQSEKNVPVGTVQQKSQRRPTPALLEDKVDLLLYKQSGTIQRDRDPRLCNHANTEKCLHCRPVECYNQAFLLEQGIHYMSFHGYLRKLTGGVFDGQCPALENISCKIKEGCVGHPPWALHFCTKCQVLPIIIDKQPYRHIDVVMFENPFLVEDFLNYSRCSGEQRIGVMYGRYERHKDVPLGIKARVAVIYEPPQWWLLHCG